MKSGQTFLLIISLVLCLAIYPFYGMSLFVMVLTTGAVAALAYTEDKKLSLYPTLLSAVIAIIFYFARGINLAIPGLLTMVASLSGFVMGKSIKGKWNLQGVLLFSAGVILAAITGTILIVNHIYDIDCINKFITLCRDISYVALSDAQEMLPVTMTAQEIKSYVNVAYEYLTIVVPSTLIIICGLYAYTAFGIARYMLKKIRVIIPMLPDRRQLIMSRGSGWIMLFVWLLTYVVSNDMIKYALMNISVIISALMLICGISLVLYLIEYKVKIRGIKWLLRMVLFFSLFTSIYLPELLVMAAIIDTSWNFRRISLTIINK